MLKDTGGTHSSWTDENTQWPVCQTDKIQASIFGQQSMHGHIREKQQLKCLQNSTMYHMKMLLVAQIFLEIIISHKSRHLFVYYFVVHKR